MKTLFTFLFIASFCMMNGQNIKRLENETLQNFAERMKPIPNSEISGEILEVKSWNQHKNVIFVFYLLTYDHKELVETFLDGYIFVPIGNNAYRKIFIDRYSQEGADAEVLSVFFANADKDGNKELGIICSWNQSGHHGISGSLYQTYFYDEISGKQKSLKPITTFEKNFPIEFDGSNDSDEESVAKFKTAEQVKKQLKKLGY